MKTWSNAGEAGLATLPWDYAALEAMTSELCEVESQLLTTQAALAQCARDGRAAAMRAKQLERSRVAQMLHDGLQQVLVAANMRLALTLRLLPPGKASDAAQETRELVAQAITASRTLVLDLNAREVVEAGLGPALIWLSDWFATFHGLKVTVEVTTDAEPELEAVRVLVFQGVREILFNAVKHARIDNAHVRMVRAGTHVQIAVEDQGVGFEPAAVAGKTDGFGLFSVKRRLEVLGGAMEVISAPGEGTRVVLKAPIVGSGAAVPFKAFAME